MAGWQTGAPRGGVAPGGLGIGPADPSARPVLRGDGNGGRTVFKVQIVLGPILLAFAVAVLVFVLSLDSPASGPLVIEAIAASVPAIVLVAEAVAHTVRVRKLAGTELWISPHGVAYTCAAGCYGVPWSAVRWIGFRGRPGGRTDRLCVDAFGWRGPVAKLGSAWRTTRTLEINLSGTDRRTVAQAVHAAGGVSIGTA